MASASSYLVLLKLEFMTHEKEGYVYLFVSNKHEKEGYVYLFVSNKHESTAGQIFPSFPQRKLMSSRSKKILPPNISTIQ